MKKIRIGVVGVGRGRNMIQYCLAAGNAELVAICDKWEEGLERQRREHAGLDIAYYTDYDAFLRHDMDAVVLANYANQHAPFAIKAMRAGKHVFSEVLPVQNLSEAVALAEAVEETGMTYAYGENYCYMPAPREMRRLYQENKIGEVEYAECEYIHNCEMNWHSLTCGDENHWRNTMCSTYYCTHSIGPILHITGLRPVSVTGFEGTKMERNLRVGAKGGQFAVEMLKLSNGAIVRSTHGFLYKNSIWYSIYGGKGRMESAREDAQQGDVSRIYVNADAYSGEYAKHPVENYEPKDAHSEEAKPFGHGGSDFYCLYNFVEKLLGNPEADTIDVYEALDMSLPGLMAYRSILAGGVPMEVPDMRDPAVREKYRSDTACTTDPDAAGEKLLPTCSLGTPQIDPAVYANMREKWLDKVARDREKAADSH